MSDNPKKSTVDNHLVITVIRNSIMDIKQLPTYRQAVRYANAILLYWVSEHDEDLAALYREKKAALANALDGRTTGYSGWAKIDGDKARIDVFIEPTTKSAYDANELLRKYDKFLAENPDIAKVTYEEKTI